MKKYLILPLLILLCSTNNIMAHDVVKDLEAMTQSEAMSSYFSLGFKHILPLGFDHILFIVSLVLLSPNIKQLLHQSLAFTAGHCLTLGLSMTKIIVVPSTIIEPIIAATIVYMAFTNLFTDKLVKSRLIIILVFGLLHGIGFASALSETGLPQNHFFTALFTFNIGVEFGQMAVIVSALLGLKSIQKVKQYSWTTMARPCSLAIMIIGTYWFVEKII